MWVQAAKQAQTKNKARRRTGRQTYRLTDGQMARWTDGCWRRDRKIHRQQTDARRGRRHTSERLENKSYQTSKLPHTWKRTHRNYKHACFRKLFFQVAICVHHSLQTPQTLPPLTSYSHLHPHPTQPQKLPMGQEPVGPWGSCAQGSHGPMIQDMGPMPSMSGDPGRAKKQQNSYSLCKHSNCHQVYIYIYIYVCIYIYIYIHI